MTLLPRRAASVLAAFAAAIVTACSSPDGLTAPVTPDSHTAAARKDNIRAAIAAQERHHGALHAIKGVVGTAVGLRPDGSAAVQVLVMDATPRNIPAVLDNIPVDVRVTGLIVARSDPTIRLRPAYMGYSVGHPLITAGTIGARVTDGTNVFVLSNNHVLAASNDAHVGDPELQPGPYDGGSDPGDRIGTLYAFRALDFNGGNNTIDAAIAITDALSVANSTPPDDGYGQPSTTIFGDANNDGTIDDKTQLLGLNVQKYGRTTKLTHGTITGINGIVDVCYEVYIIFCLKSAHYVDQLIITPGTFSGGGDSGSLIVADDGSLRPVALLFAGSNTETIGNRIDLVLTNFGVAIDGSTPVPPAPVTDVAVNSVNAPGSVVAGATTTVSVVVKNVGNQPVGAFDVSLTDQTDAAALGTQTVGGLAGNASTTLSYSWNTTASSIGSHTLTASHTLADDNAANNQASTTVQVTQTNPATDIHIGDLDPSAARSGLGWNAIVEITAHDGNHNPLNGVTVSGVWNVSGTNANTCTTGNLGGNGTCIVMVPGVKLRTQSVTYTVLKVTMPNHTYVRLANHDPDGSSNGTVQKVNRP
jgi:hypothetical protein